MMLAMIFVGGRGSFIGMGTHPHFEVRISLVSMSTWHVSLLLDYRSSAEAQKESVSFLGDLLSTGFLNPYLKRKVPSFGLRDVYIYNYVSLVIAFFIIYL